MTGVVVGLMIKAVMTNDYLVKWYLFQDALTRNRTDGALVRRPECNPGANLEKRTRDYRNSPGPSLFRQRGSYQSRG